MRKIWILAGIIGILIIVISAWLFIGEFSSFAKSIGKKSEDIVLTEKSKFVGTWISNEDNTPMLLGNKVTFFSDGRIGLNDRIPDFESYIIQDCKLVIQLSGMEYFYDYSFSNNNNMLTVIAEYDGTSACYIQQSESII